MPLPRWPSPQRRWRRQGATASALRAPAQQHSRGRAHKSLPLPARQQSTGQACCFTEIAFEQRSLNAFLQLAAQPHARTQAHTHTHAATAGGKRC
eukprot:356402-Chlamydomonas_euryale.AAC.2